MTSELPLYQIQGWNKHFENYKSRSVDKCGFVCVPNKHGGAGLTALLMSQPEPYGHAIYGVWQMVLQFCSRQMPPRDGWLTADGRKDGPRLPAVEWARMFRCSAELIRSTFRELQAVGFIKLVEGRAEAPDTRINTKDDTSGDTKRDTNSDIDTIADTKADTNRDTSGDTNAILSQVDEGKKEGMKEVLSLSGEQQSEDLIQHAEGKRLFGQLSAEVFDRELRENQWPYDCEHWLDKILPLKRDEWGLVHWFYHLPEDHEVFTMTSRRQTMIALLENWAREVEKIRSVRKKLGLNGVHSNNELAVPIVGWTEKRRAAFSKLYPGADPGPFHLLEREMREQIDLYPEKKI